MFRLMGYLTTVTFRNDSLHVLKENPLEFTKVLFDGIDRANFENKRVSAGLQGHCNPIEIQPSRHADDTTVFVHWGNCVFDLNPYNKDMGDMINRSPETAEKFIEAAQNILDLAKRKLKKSKEK